MYLLLLLCLSLLASCVCFSALRMPSIKRKRIVEEPLMVPKPLPIISKFTTLTVKPAKKTPLPTIVELNRDIGTALLEVVVPGKVTGMAFNEVLHQYVEDNKHLNFTCVDMFVEYGEEGVKQMCIERLHPFIEKLCNRTELFIYGPFRNISVINSWTPGESLCVQATYELMPEVTYCDGGYLEHLNVTLTDGKSLRDLIFHYWKLDKVRQHTHYIALPKEACAEPGHEVIYQKTYYEVLSDGSIGDKAKGVEKRRTFKCLLSKETIDYDQIVHQEELSDTGRVQHRASDSGSTAGDSEDTTESDDHYYEQQLQEENQEEEEQEDESDSSLLSEYETEALLTPSFATNDKSEWRDLRSFLLGSQQGDNFTFPCSEEGRELVCQYKVISVNEERVPDWDGVLAKEVLGVKSVVQLERQVSGHIKPLVESYLKSQVKDAVCLALIRRMIIRGPIPSSFVMDVAERQNKRYPLTRGRKIRREIGKVAFQVSHLRDVQRVMGQRYLDHLTPEEKFENIVKVELALLDIGRREGLDVLDKKDRSDMRYELAHIQKQYYRTEWISGQPRRMTQRTLDAFKSELLDQFKRNKAYKFVLQRLEVTFVDARDADRLSEKMPMRGVRMPAGYLNSTSCISNTSTRSSK